MSGDDPERPGDAPPARPEKRARGGAIARRALTVAGGTLVSRVLGLVRDRVIAASFPLLATDAFFVAFTIPNALRSLVAEGATSAAVVPLAGEAAREGAAAARAFVGRFFAAMAILLTGLAVLGVVAAPTLVTAYAAGYLGDDGSGDSRFGLAVVLTRLVFPYVALVGLAGVATGALHAQQRFRIASVAPAWLNVGLIVAPTAFTPLVLAAGLPPVAALCVGALAGGLAHLLTVAAAALQVGAMGPPRVDLRDPRVREGFRRLGPLVVGVGVYQANVLLSRLVASFLEVGAQSYLYYAQRLVEIPQGLLALAVASAALPTLSARHAAGDRDAFGEAVTDGLGLVLFFAFPATALLTVCAEPLVATLFRVGAFDGADVAATADALRLQALGVVAISLARALVPAYHARGDTRRPVRATIMNLLVFAPTAPLLAVWMGHPGVALAVAIAGFAQVGTLWTGLFRGAAPVPIDLPSLRRRGSIALAASGLATLPAAGILTRGWETAVGGGALGAALLAAALLAAGTVYLGVAAALGAPELGWLLRRLRR